MAEDVTRVRSPAKYRRYSLRSALISGTFLPPPPVLPARPPTIITIIISGIINMYGDSCLVPPATMMAIMPSMAPPIT
ncbi:Uncharacterised protein [Mycobacterium tuberculosis]|uniref:Uncharacterized protein n=1 Tax=Mycobacterium tuberculosis TaxID=1773 RepID=A0A654T684_MYCTX|nr:Uncharacterised protein [Mycobacterium tuberculosis]CFE79223.1 Uncharacterised protein [Mycobacterium tuberculosis]CFR81554.1 Uncharacterised protein [Mycobacterium tuberculosis]CKR14243.1 Uncharacterised protein [Mycobacterium tuberculosis]CKS71669.1 Uncharacterised protein [Mycobacterium tuberculosis]